MGKLKKTTIARFVNRKNCKAILEKKLSLSRKLGNEKSGFQSDARTFVSKNTKQKQHVTVISLLFISVLNAGNFC